jgi:Cu2+-exporting ATPase
LSEHLLAEAVTAYIKANAGRVSVTNLSSITGKGIQAMYNDKTYLVGNRRLLEEKGVPVGQTVTDKTHAWLASANTVVYFAMEKKLLAAIAIADKVKPSSVAAVKALQQMNIEGYILTGDNAQTAAAVAG